MYFRDPISIADQRKDFFKAELGDKTISPVASFVLGIHFTNTSLCASRCPFDLIDNRKQFWGRFRSHYQTDYLVLDFKKGSRLLHLCELDFMGHRGLKVMAV